MKLFACSVHCHVWPALATVPAAHRARPTPPLTLASLRPCSPKLWKAAVGSYAAEIEGYNVCDMYAKHLKSFAFEREVRAKQ